MTQTSITSSLLRKSEPKLAFNFDNETRQYDYEASGNDAVLTSPSNVTKLLQGDEAREFWVALDALEERNLDSQEAYEEQVQLMIKSVFDNEVSAVTGKKAGLFNSDRRHNPDRRSESRPDAERRQSVVENAKTWAQSVKKVDPDVAAEFAGYYLKQSPDGGALLADVWPQFQAKYGSVKYAIQVDATSLKKASVSYIAGVEWYKGSLAKLKFTTKQGSARRFSARIAKKIQEQLPEFNLTGALVKV
jgi:hypothetical protein